MPGWHGSVFLILLAMHGDTTGEAIVATIDEDGGEEFEGAKHIYEDTNVMQSLKDGEAVFTWSSKERDQVLQQAKKFV